MSSVFRQRARRAGLCLGEMVAAVMMITGCQPIMPVRPRTSATLRIVSVEDEQFPKVSAYFTARHASGAPITDLTIANLELTERADEEPQIQRLNNAAALPSIDVHAGRLFLICDLYSRLHTDVMRQAARDLVSGWERGADRFALIVSDPSRTSPDAMNHSVRAACVQKLTPDRSIITARLSALETHSASMSTVYDCLRRALDEIHGCSSEEAARTAIVLFTGNVIQGMRKDAEKAQCVIDDLVELGIPVVVVTYDLRGHAQQPSFEEFKQIAVTTGGSFFHAGGSANTQLIEARIVEAMNHFYRLDFRSGQMLPHQTGSGLELTLTAHSAGAVCGTHKFQTPEHLVERELVHRIQAELDERLTRVTKLHGKVVSLLEDCERDVTAADQSIKDGRPEEVAVRLGTAWNRNLDLARSSARQAQQVKITPTTAEYLSRLRTNREMPHLSARLAQLKNEAQRLIEEQAGELEARAHELDRWRSALACIHRPSELEQTENFEEFLRAMRYWWRYWSNATRQEFAAACITAIAARERRGERDALLSAIGRLLELPENNGFRFGASLELIQARIHERRQNYRDAADSCRRAARRDGANAELFGLWARVALRNDNLAEAERAIEYLAACPYSENETARLYVELGERYVGKQAHTKAREAFGAAAAIEGANISARVVGFFRAGDVSARIGSIDEAINHHEQALALLAPRPGAVKPHYATSIVQLMRWRQRQAGGCMITAEGPADGALSQGARDHLERIVQLADRVKDDPTLLATADRADVFEMLGCAEWGLGERAAGVMHKREADRLRGDSRQPVQATPLELQGTGQ